MANNGLVKKINIFCLLAAIIAVLVLPLKKEIWYDETVSVRCSKGISHDTPGNLANSNTTTSTALEQLNTPGNVFTSTVVDNSNSFLYNIILHWFTLFAGNSMAAYTLLSKLSGIALLIAFYVLCNLFLGNSIFTSVALVLMATDNNMMGMSHEIRAYTMGAFFITTAAIFFYKFVYEKDSPFYLFLTGLCSVAAVLSHFLSVYVVLVFLCVLVYHKKWALLSVKNLLAMLLPIGLLGLFFYYSLTGLQVMDRQNQQIQLAASGFSVGEVLVRGMRFTAVNFKAVFPAFAGKTPVIIVSFLLILSLYIMSVKATVNNTEKRNLHLLFFLGASGSIFLSLLCIKSHHYTALYYRYFSFCIPFCCLFTAYMLSVFFNSTKTKPVFKAGLMCATLLPAVALFIFSLSGTPPRVKYNHVAVASEIVKDNVTKIEVPEWDDALLIQCFLPSGYKIDYVRNPINTTFTLYKANTEQKIPVIRDNS